MKAIKIKVDFNTGERAGGVNPRSPNLKCHPTWQDLDNGWEIRSISDEAADRYRGVEGITVLENEAEITAELEANFPHKVMWKVTNEALLNLSLRQINPDLSSLSQDATHDEELEFLYNAGCRGIGRIVRATETPRRVFGIRDEVMPVGGVILEPK
jgi:hypothetical protein